MTADNPTPSMTGKMYKVRARFSDPERDDYIVVETLNHIVALENARTQNVHWVTRHVLNLEYIEKVSA